MRSCWLVWDKAPTATSRDAELAWTNHTRRGTGVLMHMWNGMLRASEHGKRVHPTQKPVALREWAFSVIDPTAERKVVLDAFGGLRKHPHRGAPDRTARRPCWS